MIGVLLVNLGTPQKPTKRSVRKYLAEFLSDPRVVEIPRPIWWLILHGFILRTRPKQSAKAYQKIWTDAGSPLLINSQHISEQLQQTLSEKSVQVVLAMRYGEPSLQSGLHTLKNAGVEHIIVLPLYPQYSVSTTASVFDLLTDELKTWRAIPKLTFINDYHKQPDYINAIVSQIKQHWQNHGRAEKLLFSFHGLPQQMVDKGDPYYEQCQGTVKLVVEQLELPEKEWILCFQSRLGKAAWLQPYTDKTLEKLGKTGCQSVDVICPGFSADCLETLEEINMLNREHFLDAGGQKFSYIPALNSSPQHINALRSIIEQHMPVQTPDFLITSTQV